MPVSLETEIANAVLKCVDGSLPLEEFRRWFVPMSLDIELSGNQEAIDLVYRIDGLLAEASSGKWSEDEIREELERIQLPFGPTAENCFGIPMSTAESYANTASNTAITCAT